MSDCVRNIAILGSTGSIGCSTLDVAESCSERLRVLGLTANSRFEQLCEQSRRVLPRWIVATNDEAAQRFDWSRLPSGIKLLHGQKGIEWLVQRDEVDVVVSAIVAYISIDFFMRFVTRIGLLPFAAYRIVLAAIILYLLV